MTHNYIMDEIESIKHKKRGGSNLELTANSEDICYMALDNCLLSSIYNKLLFFHGI